MSSRFRVEFSDNSGEKGMRPVFPSQKQQEQTRSERENIIARVDDLAKWKALPYINHGTETVQEDNSWIVTAQVSSADIAKIQKLSFVKSIQRGAPLFLPQEQARSYSRS